MSADPTHSHAEFHRGLVPEDQLADLTPTPGYVVTATGGGEAEWAPAGGGPSGGWPVVYTYDDSSTADADPGAGLFRFDDADPTLAGFLYIDDLDANGNDVSVWIESWPSVGGDILGYLRLRSEADPGVFALYQVFSYAGHAGYSGFQISWLAGAGPSTSAADTAVDFWPNAYPGTLSEITTIPTAETDTDLRLAPDGVGGVEWSTGGGGSLASWGSRW